MGIKRPALFGAVQTSLRFRTEYFASQCIPFLFSRYIRDLIYETAYSGFGCKIANHSLNILAYADDIVLLAPSWKALQNLLSILYAHAMYINMFVEKLATAFNFNNQKFVEKLATFSCTLMMQSYLSTYKLQRIDPVCRICLIMCNYG